MNINEKVHSAVKSAVFYFMVALFVSPNMIILEAVEFKSWDWAPGAASLLLRTLFLSLVLASIVSVKATLTFASKK
jgi:hypothetical protein